MDPRLEFSGKRLKESWEYNLSFDAFYCSVMGLFLRMNSIDICNFYLPE